MRRKGQDSLGSGLKQMQGCCEKGNIRNLRVLHKAENFTSRMTVGLSMRTLLHAGNVAFSITVKNYVTKICALLGYNAALSGSSVSTFRDTPSVPSSRVKKSKMLRHIPEERRSHLIAAEA
jgi:hypothetical protein